MARIGKCKKCKKITRIYAKELCRLCYNKRKERISSQEEVKKNEKKF